MIELTPKAAVKILGVINRQNPRPTGLRISIIGGGCSGFSYSLSLEKKATPMDKIFSFNERGEKLGEDESEGKDEERKVLKVFVDQTSAMYLKGTKIDYVETLEGAGFKFENPNVKTTCGCGSSFSA